MEYYLEARDAAGQLIGSLGGPATPFLYSVPKLAQAPADAVTPPAKSGGSGAWYSKWWFWTGAGVAAAAVTGGIVLALSGGCRAPDGQGCVEVQLR